jgi:hypothetical protein
MFQALRHLLRILSKSIFAFDFLKQRNLWTRADNLSLTFERPFYTITSVQRCLAKIRSVRFYFRPEGPMSRY